MTGGTSVLVESAMSAMIVRHIAGQKTRETTQPRHLLHSLAISLVFTALTLARPPAIEAQFVDSGTWLGGSATGKLPINDAKGSWRVWIDGQLRFGDDTSRFSQGVVRPAVGYALNKSWLIWA